jgi:hypothetical protein
LRHVVFSRYIQPAVCSYTNGILCLRMRSVATAARRSAGCGVRVASVADLSDASRAADPVDYGRRTPTDTATSTRVGTVMALDASGQYCHKYYVTFYSIFYG